MLLTITTDTLSGLIGTAGLARLTSFFAKTVATPGPADAPFCGVFKLRRAEGGADESGHNWPFVPFHTDTHAKRTLQVRK